MTETQTLDVVEMLRSSDHLVLAQAVGPVVHSEAGDFYPKLLDLLAIFNPETTDFYPTEEAFTELPEDQQLRLENDLIDQLDAEVKYVNPAYGIEIVHGDEPLRHLHGDCVQGSRLIERPPLEGGGLCRSFYDTSG